MQLARLSIVPVIGALALITACGTEPPAQQPADATRKADAPAPVEVAGPQRNILAFGNSLFAGYGVDKADSYPAKLETALRRQGINATVANAGVSGDTTAAGLQRLEFTLDAQKQKPDLFILELGGNDLLRNIRPSETRANLETMLAELQSRGIPVVMMGMRAPPNYGSEFQRDFDALFSDLAAKYDATFVPFFLEAIYRDPSMFQSDRIHPTAEGIEQLVAATVETVAGAMPEVEPAE